MIRRCGLVGLVLVWGLLGRLPDAWGDPNHRPVPAINRVLIISVDGLRPDVLLRGQVPSIRQLLRRGSFSFWAQTIPTANTLPSHVSMLTGVQPEVHGITFNDERATTRPFYPPVPTLFELAHRTGYSTAMVCGKSKFLALNKPGTIDWVWVPEQAKTDDSETAQRAASIIRQHRPELMFVHFAGPDTVGHSKGWGSIQQLQVIEQIDQHIGVLLEELVNAAVADSTLVILSSDHGGAGRTHGAQSLPSLHIPWIAAGPGVRANFDLTLLRDLQINTCDTFATACWVLGIDRPEIVDAKPITQIIEGYELMHDAKPAATTKPSSTATTQPAAPVGSR
ncbi:ectonucleotide pyrophosphatase/phosphodiesterase [Fontivita pretiosa]|uniref:alkaline phosphatase family protein n=1 Tax=Fontivita pretiosa TaxID=2989684 RepID=UPI003D165D82